MNDNQTALTVSYLALRRAIGVLGMALPIVLIVGNRLLGETDNAHLCALAYQGKIVIPTPTTKATESTNWSIQIDNTITVHRLSLLHRVTGCCDCEMYFAV